MLVYNYFTNTSNDVFQYLLNDVKTRY